MATQADVEAYQSAIGGLSTVAFSRVKALLLALDDPNPIAFRDALLRTYPELMAPYLAGAAEVAAEWYTQLRAGSSLGGSFVVRLPDGVPSEQLEAGLRYALSPLFQPERFIGSDILTMLAGFSQRMIADAGRDTIVSSVRADSPRVFYMRVPQPGCCAFCGLMASRGAVYRSEESAGAVVGRGVDPAETVGKRGGQGRGVKVRGLQSKGDRFHDFCRCVVAPGFPGEDDSFLAETAAKYSEMYSDSVGLKQSDYSRRNPDGPQFASTDFKSTLANWRKEFGTK